MTNIVCKEMDVQMTLRLLVNSIWRGNGIPTWIPQRLKRHVACTRVTDKKVL